MIGLQDLFNDHQLYHSEFQMDALITVRAGGTVYGQYKQALRELYKRYRGLKQLYSELALSEVDIDELKSKYTVDPFEKRRNQINLNTKILNLDEAKKNIEDTEREFKRFYAQAASLKEIIGDLDDEKRDQLDKDMWIFKMKEMAAVDFITTGRLLNNTIEFIAASPIEMRKELLNSIRPDKQGSLIDWFETKNADPLPVKQIQDYDLKLLFLE